MSDDLTPPPGDADGLKTGASQLNRAAGDLDAQTRATKSGVAEAVSEWNGPRSRQFERAGAGVQAELAVATTAVGRVSALLRSYATALESATQEIAAAKSQAATADHEATKDSDTNAYDLRNAQHARQRKASIEDHAASVKADLKRLAGKIAAQIDHEIAQAVPGGAHLSPGEIARKVQHVMGITAMGAPAAPGSSLSSDQAWKVLGAAQRAVPDDAVTASGGINWKKLAKDYASGPGSQDDTASGWAISRLVANWKQMAKSRKGLNDQIEGLTGDTRGDLGGNPKYQFNKGDPGGLEIQTTLFADGPLTIEATTRDSGSFLNSMTKDGKSAASWVHSLGTKHPWIHAVLSKTSQVSMFVAAGGDVVAGACGGAALVDGVLPSAVCEAADLPVIATAGMTSATADILDMATGGKEFKVSDFAWDLAAYPSFGITNGVEGMIAKPSVLRDMADNGATRAALRQVRDFAVTGRRLFTWVWNLPIDEQNFEDYFKDHPLFRTPEPTR